MNIKRAPRPTLAAAAVVVVVGYVNVAAAPAHAACTTQARSGVVVIGDSITVGTRWELNRRRPTWDVDALGGRPVGDLPRLTAAWECRTRPKVFILALGSNDSASWGPDSWQQVRDGLPGSVDVIIPTVFRDPAVRGDNERVRRINGYNPWILATTGITVLPWRQRVESGAVTLQDGVHPDKAGRTYRAKMYINTVARVS